MSDELDKEFQSIRKLYFTTWTDGSNWRILEYGGNGYCDRESKTIKVGGSTENYSLPVLIIHEIAHAVTIDDHGDEWVQHMREAAVRAADLGDMQLARDLPKHIDWVTGPDAYDVPHEQVYAEIAAAASDQPEATFESVVGWVAQKYGQDLKTFLEAFPQARKYYDQSYRTD
jgi:hypothetical protein